jgi:protein-L-isoaspartate(D-aspartate) O-methyltransferase
MEAVLVTRTADNVYNTVNLFETVVAPLDGMAAKPAFTF